MNLYELRKDVNEKMDAYFACFDPETGEQIATEEETDKRFAEMKELENQKDELTRWLLEKRANQMAHVAGIESEISRLCAMAARESKSIDRIENMVGMFCPPDETPKPVLFGNFSVSYRKSESVAILDESAIPAEFIRIPEPKPAPDKTAIKKAINEGIAVPGCSIEVRQNLQIK